MSTLSSCDVWGSRWQRTSLGRQLWRRLHVLLLLAAIDGIDIHLVGHLDDVKWLRCLCDEDGGDVRVAAVAAAKGRLR